MASYTCLRDIIEGIAQPLLRPFGGRFHAGSVSRLGSIVLLYYPASCRNRSGRRPGISSHSNNRERIEESCPRIGVDNLGELLHICSLVEQASR